MKTRDLDARTYKLFVIGVKAYINDSELSQKKVAEDMGLKPANLSSYLNLRTNMPEKLIKTFTDYFEETIESFVETGKKAAKDVKGSGILKKNIAKGKIVNQQIISMVSHKDSLFVATKEKIFEWNPENRIFRELQFENKYGDE